MIKTVLTILFIASSAAIAQTPGGAAPQNRNFTVIEGPTLKARIDNAITAGRSHSPGGRFWVAYQFETRPGVALDYEVVDGNGGVYMSWDNTSVGFDSRYETRELGIFFLFENERDRFTRAEIYNLKRQHEYAGYPVFWTGRASNQESLEYLQSLIDTPALETNRLGDRAAFAIAMHDDAQVESILINLIRKPIAEPMRSRLIYWLGFAPESLAKNTFLAGIVRDASEWSEPRQQAMAALGMSRSSAALPLLENLFETMTSRELKRRALAGISRNDNRDAAASYLIRVAESDKEQEIRKSAVAGLGRIAGEKSLGALTATLDSDPDTEIQKQAVMAIGRRSRDEAIPILIRTARNHPKIAVRKQAIVMLGQTGDERAVALFRELLK
jgi:hypothetical protein